MDTSPMLDTTKGWNWYVEYCSSMEHTRINTSDVLTENFSIKSLKSTLRIAKMISATDKR